MIVHRMAKPTGCIWGLAFSVTIVAGLLAGGALLYMARRPEPLPGAKGMAAEYERVRRELAAGLVVTGGAAAESHTEWLGLQSSTYQRWKLDLTLKNMSARALELGNDLFLVESSPDGSSVDGVLHRIGHPAGEPVLVSSFGLSNFDAALTDGRRLKRQANQISIQFSDTKAPAAAAAPTSFGSLAPQASRAFTQLLAEGIWLKPDTLASLRVVLPEVRTTVAGKTLRYRPVAFLTRPSATVTSWTVSRLEVVALESETLRALVATPETNLVSRVFAANWLSEVDPRAAGPALAASARPLRQGLFLACALELLARLKAPGLEAHAQTLLEDAQLPNGIRGLAARYLGAARFQPAVGALERAAADKDDVVGQGAIDALADLGGAGGRAALSKLAQARIGEERRRAAGEALARLDQPVPSTPEPLSTPPGPL